MEDRRGSETQPLHREKKGKGVIILYSERAQDHIIVMVEATSFLEEPDLAAGWCQVDASTR